MMEGELLKLEFKKQGINLVKMAQLGGLAYSTLTRKIKENNFNHRDILSFGMSLERVGGDPRLVWANWDVLKASMVHGTPLNISDKEIKKMALIKAVPLVEGSVLQKESGQIIIPGFDNLDYWIRILSTDINCEQYRPGQVFGLKKVENIDSIIFGGLYHVVCSTFESLRIIKRGTDNNSFTVEPLNKAMEPHILDLRKKVDLYEIKGVISWI